jgi:hypothetical protein
VVPERSKDLLLWLILSLTPNLRKNSISIGNTTICLFGSVSK